MPVAVPRVMTATVVLLMALGAAPLPAQFLLHVDLSGSWTLQEGDDLRYADPALDDSGWRSIRLPLEEHLPPGVRWLRKVVDLPAKATDDPLVLTLGNLAPPYTVFINGKRIGDVDAAPPRVRQFALPAGVMTPGRNVVAIRSLFARGGNTMRGQNLADQGPYLLTDRSSAPQQIEALSRDRRLRHGALVLVAGGLFSLLAGLVLVLWLGERERRELALLGAFLACDAILRLGTYLSIVLDTGEYTYPFLHLGVIPLAYLTLGILQARPLWITILIWLQALYGVASIIYSYGISDSRPSALLGLWQIIALVLLGVGLYRVPMIWRAWRRESKVPALPLLALTLLALYALRSYAFQLFNVNFVLGGFLWNSYDMAMLASSFTMVLVLLRKLTDDRREKVRLNGELEAARAVQQLLLPGATALPGDTPLVVDPVYYPAHEVGGDFYQVLRQPEGSTLILIGDVSGKGLKAAMVVSLLTGVARAHHTMRPAALLGEMNRVIGTNSGVFVTCLALHVDAAGGGAVVANAGHLAPYRNGEELSIENGLPLGVLAGTEYVETPLQFRATDRFTLVTDGVVEAASAAGELFGFERTRAISLQPAKQIGAAALAWGQNDDITVVSVRWTAWLVSRRDRDDSSAVAAVAPARCTGSFECADSDMGGSLR